jgi:hypothetical protein
MAFHTTSLYTLSPSLLILLTPFLLAAVVLASTRLYTTLRYRLSLTHYTSAPENHTKPYPPPSIPYTLPILGSALSFLAPRPGAFWAQLFRSHPRATGACTLLLGGRTMHVLFSPSAVQALFKSRGPSRHGFNQDVLEKALGMEKHEARRFFGVGESPNEKGLTPLQQQENINHDFLLRTDSVNELTAEFTRTLREQLADELCGGGDRTQEVLIYVWLRARMFKASTTAFMGKRIFEVYPGLGDDFFDVDSGFLSMLFGIPKWFIPAAYEVRERTLDGLERWHMQLYEKCKGKPVDPEGDVKWEPMFGSRANRARQRYYESRGMSVRARAALDLGFLFGLSSNAIPATGWMLMHILNPGGDKTLLGRVMEELEKARCEDGTLDIPMLLSLPLLQSVFHEVLRLYVDVLIRRELKEDLTLPLDDGKRQVLLKKSGIVMAPSWLGHRDEARWVDPPCKVFYAERFLKVDPETGKDVFTVGGTTGKFFPFGGGKSICPGRVFAKQEVLASVALVLLTFEFEVVRFVDGQGKTRKGFPGIKQAYSGTGVVAMDGDIKVRMRRRERSSGSR